jgi:hypothetical protein
LSIGPLAGGKPVLNLNSITMKKLLLFFGSVIVAASLSAQCTPSISQSPSVIPCNGSGTLTANVPSMDINQPSNTVCMANFSQTDVAQSFIAVSSTMCGAGIFLTSGSGSATITLTLYNLLPNAGGVVMATGSVAVTGPGVWADVTWPSTAVTPGNTYYIVFTSTNGNICIGGSTSNPYSGGMVYANAGFGAFPSYDYTFHTFSCGGPVTYLWSTGATTQTIPVTTGGVYSVTITVGPCTGTASYNLVMAGPTSTITSTNVLCNGGNNGSASVNASGGTGPYTYSWSPSGGTNPTASGLTANGYTCTITDNNGCTTTSSVNITAPTPLVPNITSTPINCNGGSSSITITASGGTPAYSGTGTVVASAGTYTYNIVDAHGCSAPASVTITQPSPISPGVVTTNVSCNGNTDGAVNLTVSGGVGPYTFNWNSGTYTTEDLSGLSPGTYVGAITDASNCVNNVTVVITQPAVLTASVISTTNPSGCGTMDGSIDITVSGGTTSYTYVWSTSAPTQDLNTVGPGTYSCAITDAHGCTATVNSTLTGPTPPTVTFSLPIDTLCSNWGAYTLSGGSPSGGTFTGTAVASGMFDPAAAGAGTHVITYSYTDALGCSGTSSDSVYVDLCLGTTQSENTSLISVFPNPNDGSFTVTSPSSGDMMIYDAQGKLVHEQWLDGGKQNVISLNESGVYMMMIITVDGSSSTQRVIVTR